MDAMPSATLAIGMSDTVELRGLAARDPDAALKAASQQFEAIFLNMMLKSMRDATPESGLMQGEEGKIYQEMMDRQLSQLLASRGATGLAGLIERQLSGTKGAPAGAESKAADMVSGSRFEHGTLRSAGVFLLQPGNAGAASSSSVGSSQKPSATEPATGSSAPAREFVERVWPHAMQAATATGVPAQFLVAQAALETGWGRAEIRLPDGRPSYNLFNIKAGSGWNGERATVQTTEFENGVAIKRTDSFRVYGSYAEAFRDYARLLDLPRYAAVRGTNDPESFARGLQRAGYATDPAYADKLMRIMNGPMLRQALAG